MPETFVKRTRLPVSAREAYEWHLRPGALERLAPPWERVRVLDRGEGIKNGARTVLQMRLGPVRMRWIAEHFGVIEGEQFCDKQISGPFAQWEHAHRFETIGASECFIEDRIEYTVPFGAIGAAAGGRFAHAKIRRLFDYRHATTRADLESIARRAGGRSMKVAVTGMTGLVGSALLPLLTTRGHSAARFARGTAAAPGEIAWDPERGTIDAAALEGVDAVLHLAGENVGAGRWTQARKRRIMESRTKGTRLLAETLAAMASPPRALICASAVGIYGSRGDEILSESSAPGAGFLADVCKAWEAAAEPARAKGIRVAHLRFGVILSPAGGALARMLLPFRLGAGGRIGSGRQWMSWVSLDDAAEAIVFALENESVRGPANVVAPAAARNDEFTRTLGLVLRRPTIFPMPAFAAKLAFGEMGEELLLASQRVEPRALAAAGFRFRHPDLAGALRHMLGRTA